MPRRKDSKRSPAKKHRQARGEDQSLGDAQATPAGEGVSPSSVLPESGCPPPTPLAAGTAKCSQISPATSSPAATTSCEIVGEGSTIRVQGSPGASQSLCPGEISHTDHLTWSVGMLVEVLLEKFKMKECITQQEMLNIIPNKLGDQFPEILQRATECMEMVFGLDLKEVDPSNQSYVLVGKLNIPNQESPSGNSRFPKNGILMPILGFILLYDNCITEDKMWEFLNAMGVYAGKRHVIFGEPRKFITEDLVQLRYLDYRQVPSSDPPRYEFLWGPRAHRETTKMEVICFWAKAHHRVLRAFQALHE